MIESPSALKSSGRFTVAARLRSFIFAWRGLRWLLLAIGLVWLAEAFNTAIEQMCDRIEPNFDPVIGRIKDVCAGAVLVASIVAAGIGLLTLGPPAWAMLVGIHP